MKFFFSNGIFTFDASTIILMNIIMGFISILVAFSFPQDWWAYVYEGLFILLDLIILFAVIKRNKYILNICFWIAMTVFIFYSIGCIVYIPLSYFTMYDINSTLYEYGPKGRKGKEAQKGDQLYVSRFFDAILLFSAFSFLKSMENYYMVMLVWWFLGYIYLCAINEARRECTELKQFSVESEVEKKPIV